VEITLGNMSGIISTHSYAMGSVRLLRILDQRQQNGNRFNQLVNRYVDVSRQRLKKDLDGRKIELCVGTGGSIESIGEIRRNLLGKNTSSRVTTTELASISRTIQSLSIEDRVRKLSLRPDRADVISPAAIVLHKIAQQAGVREILIPGVGVKEGILAEIVWEMLYRGKHLDHEQILHSALQLGRKYSFDEKHGLAVSRLATQIFDQTLHLHDLDGESRLLLEVAALLHDIGHFIGVSSHHKHSFYLLQAGPIVGLSPAQMEIVANIARYHRKSLPKLEHLPFKSLPPKQRHRVSTLGAILRVADAIDRQHSNSVSRVGLVFKGPKVLLRLHGKADLLLEKWALSKRKDLFEEIFGRLDIEESLGQRTKVSEKAVRSRTR
jgi:exopolyphosphatase / guanosine-5'-triphosphate,3'-diphosphate pyrophosphatase